MTYHFKPKPEVIRSVGMAIATYMLEAFADPQLATDPRGWAIAAGIGIGHAVAVALIALYTTSPQAAQAAPGAAQAPPQDVSPAAPVKAVQPPEGAVWVNGRWVPGMTDLNFGALDVRAGQSRPAQPPAPPAAPPAPTEDELRHQRNSERSLKAAATMRARREAAAQAAQAEPEPPAVPIKPNARRKR